MLSVTYAEADARNLVKKHFGYTPAHVASGPGSVELLGDATGCADGLVMAVAVDRGVHIASAPRTDGRIELVSSAFPQPELFWLTELELNPAAAWADGVKGVLHQLRSRGVHSSGFSAAIHNSIPTGLDLGSGAALEVATALAVRQLYPYSLTETGATLPPKRDGRGGLPPLSKAERRHLARLCRDVDNKFLGGRSGFADHVPALFGKAWNVLSIDCRFETVEPTPLVGEALIICGSGADVPQAADWNAELRMHWESAAQKLRAKSLRSVEPQLLAANRGRLTAREYECAYHVVGEIARGAAGERALRDDDHRQFGHFLFQSHESARDFLKNSTPELDLLVELARAHPGCLGARPTSGRRGGATINLVAYHQAESFIETVVRQYERRTGHEIRPLACQIVNGAA